MRVLLLNPPRRISPQRQEVIVNAPLAACLITGYIAATLRAARIPVEVLEADLEDWDLDQTASAIASTRSTGERLLLGVHLVYQWEETLDILRMLEGLKAEGNLDHLSLYGFFPTFAWRELLGLFPFVDSIVRGEPELTFLELVRRLSGGHEWRDARGLAWMDQGRLQLNPARPLIDPLDPLPFPLRPPPSLLQGRNPDNYLLGSRGCYNHCSFCYLTPFYQGQRRWRGRTPQNIVSEIGQVLEETGSSSFYFADANFFGPGEKGQERARELARILRGEGLSIRFGLECRANDVQEETLAQLQEAGLTHLFVGIESGSDEVLGLIEKNTTASINEEAVRTAQRLGLKLSTGFIMFEPDARLGHIRESFEFLKRLGLLRSPSITAHLLHHPLVVLRGTKSFSRLLSQDRLAVDPLLQYEGRYRFVDPRVESLAQLMTRISCRALQTNEDQDYDPQEGCYRIPHALEGERLRRLNDLLIDTFARALEWLEAGGDGPAREGLAPLEEAFSREIVK